MKSRTRRGIFGPLANGEHYYLVAYTDGYIPDFVEITELTAGQTKAEQDLSLAEANLGYVDGDVRISGGNNTEQYATLSFRQEVGVDSEIIEIKSINVLNTFTYKEELPEDSYTLVASTLFGFETEPYPLTVTAGEENTLPLDVVLDTPEQ